MGRHRKVAAIGACNRVGRGTRPTNLTIRRGGQVRFRDRCDAGRQLVDRLASLKLSDPLILALPRGGVPVAFEIAEALRAPLDVVVARKIGAPGHRELGIGAIAEGGGVVADEAMMRMLGITDARFKKLAEQERPELERRIRLYRGGRSLPAMAGRDVVLVDDGVATGVTAEAAVGSARRAGADRVILAVPTCAPESARRLENIADVVVCIIEPANFVAVGQWYKDFAQISDQEVLRLLRRASQSDKAEG
jgi:putative phosphoribosyl transferase